MLGEVRPAWALFENPPGIGDVGLNGILAGVEAQGYAVRVFSIPACAVGAPHRRERYWIVCRNLADSGEQGREGTESAPGADGLRAECAEGDVDDAGCLSCGSKKTHAQPQEFLTDSRRDIGFWQNFVWLPCADGKVRRAPDDTFGVVDGLHRSVLRALGNSIVPQVAARIIEAMVRADGEA